MQLRHLLARLLCRDFRPENPFSTSVHGEGTRIALRVVCKDLAVFYQLQFAPATEHHVSTGPEPCGMIDDLGQAIATND